MKFWFAALILAGSTVWAQTIETTPNLVYTSVNPAPTGSTLQSSWTGFIVTNSTGGGTTGGNVPSYNLDNGTFYFGYGGGTVAYTYAINSALSGTGIQIQGYDYTWDIYNLNGGRADQAGTDTLTAKVQTFRPDGSIRREDSWVYNTRFDWTTFSGTVNYVNPGAPIDFGNMRISFQGNDTGNWAGYYGPQVRNIGLSLNYSVDQCAANPLSSTECPGYQQAYLTQQCSANPLYDTSCPGYATAYHNQQCSANPLYASTCTGYQQAYFDQQCAANSLYNNQCPGYAQAYFDQQCAANSLYNNQCPGYAQAYFDQQCSLDPFYNNQCPGYAAAYLNQQCGLNPLYDQSCSGYQQAYYNQQCGLNPLYDSGCPNYAIVSAATQPPVAAAEPEPTVVAQASVSAMPEATVSEPTSTTSATSPTSVSPAAVVSVINPVSAPAAPAASSRSAERDAAKTEARAAEQKAEAKKTERAVSRVIPRGATGQAAAKAAAEAAESAAADAAAATTIEAQQAAQNLVLGLMGYNPAFSAYQNSIVPDTNAATMARQYNRPTVDNRSALRQLSGASDRLHQEMIDQQYGRMP
jgi:hypothetical protein